MKQPTGRRGGAWGALAAGAVASVLGIVVVSLVEREAQEGLVWLAVAPGPMLAIALFLWWRRPDHRVARDLLGVGAAFVIATFAEFSLNLGFKAFGGLPGAWLPLLAHSALLYVAASFVCRLLALLPDGLPHDRWERSYSRAVWLLPALPLLRALTDPAVPVDPAMFESVEISSGIAVPALRPLAPAAAALAEGLGPLAVVLAGLAILLRRYRLGDAELRTRVKWVFAAGLLIVAGQLLLPAVRAFGFAPGGFVEFLFFLPVVLLPVSIVVSVLRYQLFDIDLVLRRSLVYGAASFAIAGGYVGIAALLGTAAADRLPVAGAVMVTIVAMLGFQPTRRRLNLLAERRIFGERVSRYDLLTQFGETLEHAFDLGELAPRIAEAVRSGLRLRWARLRLALSATAVSREPATATLETAAVAGDDGAGEPPSHTQPLVHAGDWLGVIECGPTLDGEFNDDDRALLTTLARQAALGVHNARLAVELSARLDEIARQAGELSASRARIVHAQDAERRRLERDIHDGVQQEIVALAARLRLARNLRRADPERCDAVLTELQEEAVRILDDVRELARGIHPPVLADRGLVAAVVARAAKLPIGVAIEAQPEVRDRRFPEDVEAAAYFVLSEGLANVLKHSRAETARVSIRIADQALVVEVADDGVGFLPAGPDGTGLTGLRDRVEALGGALRLRSRPGEGVVLTASLPVPVRDAHV